MTEQDRLNDFVTHFESVLECPHCHDRGTKLPVSETFEDNTKETVLQCQRCNFCGIESQYKTRLKITCPSCEATVLDYLADRHQQPLLATALEGALETLSAIHEILEPFDGHNYGDNLVDRVRAVVSCLDRAKTTMQKTHAAFSGTVDPTLSLPDKAAKTKSILDGLAATLQAVNNGYLNRGERLSTIMRLLNEQTGIPMQATEPDRVQLLIDQYRRTETDYCTAMDTIDQIADSLPAWDTAKPQTVQKLVAELVAEQERLQATVNVRTDQVSNQATAVREYRDALESASTALADCDIYPDTIAAGIYMLKAEREAARQLVHKHQSGSDTQLLRDSLEATESEVSDLEQRLDVLAHMLRDAGTMTDCLDMTGALQALVNERDALRQQLEQTKADLSVKEYLKPHHEVLDRVAPAPKGKGLLDRLVDLEGAWLAIQREIDTLKAERDCAKDDRQRLNEQLRAVHGAVNIAGIGAGLWSAERRVELLSQQHKSLKDTLAAERAEIQEAHQVLEHYAGIEGTGTLATKITAFADTPVLHKLRETEQQLAEYRGLLDECHQIIDPHVTETGSSLPAKITQVCGGLTTLERAVARAKEVLTEADTTGDISLVGLAIGAANEIGSLRNTSDIACTFMHDCHTLLDGALGKQAQGVPQLNITERVKIVCECLQTEQEQLARVSKAIGHKQGVPLLMAVRGLVDQYHYLTESVERAHKLLNTAGIAGSDQSDITLDHRVELLVNSRDQQREYWQRESARVKELLNEQTDLQREVLNLAERIDCQGETILRLEAIQSLVSMYGAAVVAGNDTGRLLNDILTMIFAHHQHLSTTGQITSYCSKVLAEYREAHGLTKIDALLGNEPLVRDRDGQPWCGQLADKCRGCNPPEVPICVHCPEPEPERCTKICDPGEGMHCNPPADDPEPDQQRE